MSIGGFLHQSWIRRLQGEYVLPTARILYLAIAGLSLLAAILGIVAVIIFEFGMERSAALRPLPDIPAPAAVSVDLDTILNGFLPPTNIHAVPIDFARPITTDTLLVYFDADSSRGLAQYPDDFLILGGPDAQLFERGSAMVNGIVRTALKPTATLAEQLNQPSGERQFRIRVAAKDAGGSVSQPVMLVLTVSPGAVTPRLTPAEPPPVSALESLAQRIALFVDPHRTPAYFDAYQRAQQVPAACGTAPYDLNFVAQYQRAFDYMRTRIAPDRIEYFYGELCRAWRVGVRARALGMAQAQAARDQAIAENMQEQMRAEVRAVEAHAERNAAVIVVVGALGIFLFLSLFLAFLAIENHSKAMRETLEVLAERRDSV